MEMEMAIAQMHKESFIEISIEKDVRVLVCACEEWNTINGIVLRTKAITR